MEQNQISSALNQKIVSRDYHQKWLKIGGIGLGSSAAISFFTYIAFEYFNLKNKVSERIDNFFFLVPFCGGVILAIIFLLFTIYHLIYWLTFQSQVKKLVNNTPMQRERERERERDN